MDSLIGRALLVLGSRLKNEVNMHVSWSVSPPCLFSLIAFEVRCIGRVLSVLGSRLKNEVCIHVSLCFSSMFMFTDGFWNLVYWKGTVSSRLTLKERGIHTNTYTFPCVYLRCSFSLHAVHVGWDENASGHLHYNKMQLLSDGNSTRQHVDKIIRSPNRTKRPNRQTCKGHCH